MSISERTLSNDATPPGGAIPTTPETIETLPAEAGLRLEAVCGQTDAGRPGGSRSIPTSHQGRVPRRAQTALPHVAGALVFWRPEALSYRA